MRHTFVILLGCVLSLGAVRAQCPDGNQVSLSSVATDVRCNMGSDGSISIIVDEGTPPFTYSWFPDVSSSATATGLSAGVYSVTVTDSLGCASSLNVAIKQPGAFVYNVIIKNVSCFGGSDGSLNFSLSGGTPPYTYEWTDVSTNTIIATTEDISNLTAGIYGLEVVDFNGCRGGIFYLIAQAQEMTLQGAVTNVTCPGGSDGSIQLTVTGGTGTKRYAWSSGESSRNIFNKTAGTYTVTVADVNGCTATSSFNITEPEPLNATASITNPLCNGDSDGALDITATGGTPPYSFLWSTGDTSEDLSNLAVGEYCVTITDSRNCVSDPICFTINEPPQLSIAADITNVSCPGNADGAIDVTVSGGTPPYSFSWTGGDTTEDLSDLSAGAYTVIVTDVNGCTAEEGFIVNIDEFLVPSIGITQPLCNRNNGSVTVSVSGGTPPFSVQWSTGHSGITLDSLVAGSYSVTLTDANGCSVSTIADVSDVSTLSVTGTPTNSLCGSTGTGAIDIVVTGGTGSYTFEWSTGDLIRDLRDLSVGTYTLTVTDSLECQGVTTFSVNEESGMSITPSTTTPACRQSDGSISISVSGGTPPYSYEWGNQDTAATLTGLPAGVYAVTVTDVNGCEETEIIILLNPTPPDVAIIQTDITCDNPTGTLEAVVSNGTPPFTIIWSTGDSTAVISGLQPGIYWVQVIDNLGCTNGGIALLPPALGVVMEAAQTEPSCNGSEDAAIDVTVVQGASPFIFQWSTGENTEDISGITAGTYNITVTDEGGCSATTEIDIEEPEEITATQDSIVQPECSGDSTGSIYISANGGNAPYNFQWSTGDTTEDLTNVVAGEYCVVITDSNGCVSDIFCFTVAEPQPIQIQPNITQPVCNGDTTGSITVSVTGGTPPFTYIWSTGDTTDALVDLNAGSYSVTAEDGNGCTAEGTYEITEPDSVTATVSDSSNVTCNGAVDGTITVQASGGTPPYTYDWSNGDSLQSISGLDTGNYFVIVTDFNGCSDTSDVITITEPDSLLVTGNVTQPICTADGSIDVTASGGTLPYSYEWSSGDTTEGISGIGGNGVFDVTVTDAKGCTASASFFTDEPPVMDVEIIVEVELPCNGDTSGILCAIVGGVPGPHFFLWSTGDTTQCIPGLPAGMYSVTVADGNGCSAYENDFPLTEPDSITITATVDSVTCFGGNDGSVRVSVSGGTPPYSYIWSNSDTGSQVLGLAAGILRITVTDANECTATLSVNVPQPAPLDFSGSVAINPECDTTADGTITAVVTQGTPPYIFVWADGTIGASIENLPEGEYSVTVTDADGCTGTETFSLDGPICNEPPVAIDDTARFFICQEESIDIPVLNNDYDPDGDAIYVAAILGVPFNGTVHVNADQTVTYVPGPAFTGVDSFQYLVCEISSPFASCDTGTVIVTVLPCRPNIIIPTGFSPNGDGTNDDFVIPGIEFFPDNELRIFNRWGNKVREFYGYKNEWKGTNNDYEPLPDGTYYFILELNDEANTTYTGYVVIHR